MNNLKILLEAYKRAPEIYKPGRYWQTYEKEIVRELDNIDIRNFRNGDHPVFATFGFNEIVYENLPKIPFYLKVIKKLTNSPFISSRPYLPYKLRLDDIREMAYVNCINQGKLAGLPSIDSIEVSDFGSPEDLFFINGKKYSMQFLSYYIRLCFFNRSAKLRGNEIIVELGSGSGFQVELIKKLFPGITVLCFDLPYQLVLCETYLENALGSENVIKSNSTIELVNLKSLQPGKIYMFGNWLFPLLKEFDFDIFWNAASFGEMEPNIVQNYLSSILNSCQYIYLLQAEKGKESNSNWGVKNPILYEDYLEWLKGFELLNKENAYQAHRRLSQSGGYFQAVFKSTK